MSAALRDALGNATAMATLAQHGSAALNNSNASNAELAAVQLRSAPQRNATGPGEDPENVAQAILIFYAVLVSKGCMTAWRVCEPSATRSSL
jgi:hypothetical protein